MQTATLTTGAAPSAANSASPPVPVAVIDVGSNSIRMCIAEIAADGRVRTLEELTQPVRLGLDTFRRGRIGGAAMRAALAALAGFRRAMAAYRVSLYRAVATSAVREAANCDAFLDRVRISTGLELENVEGIEESRLTFQVLRDRLADRHGLTTDNVMIFALGSGSAEITVLEAGRVLFSETRRIGGLRMLEMLDAAGEKSARRLLGVFLDDVADSVRRLHPDAQIRRLVLSCPDLLRVADQLTGPPSDDQPSDVVVVPRARFDQFRAALFAADPAERAAWLDLRPDEGETLLPSLMAVDSFWRLTQAAEAVLTDVSMIDGLLLELSRRPAALRAQADSGGGSLGDPSGPRAELRAEPRAPQSLFRVCGPAACDDTSDEFHAQLLNSAVGLGRRYHFDEDHARQVHKLGMQLFDQTAQLHGLGPHERLLLEVACLLHDVGLYISPASHHKHSMYLIRHSELMGLTRDDLNVIAVVARYHRRSVPRPQHPEFAGLPRSVQMTVTKLAALLRLAEALDRSHAQAVRAVRLDLSDAVGREAELSVLTDDDLSLERWSLPGKADLFESLYGLSVRLRIKSHTV